MTSSTTPSARRAHQDLVGHRHYRYRGCAPDPDQPTQAAGDLELSVHAWEAPDLDGGEDQALRHARERAAKAVCAGCPVVAECLAYGVSTDTDGRLAVPYGILGGATMLERHRMFISTRQAAADDARLRTAQKLAVLAALAAHTDPQMVAEAAGVDVRTANWQRSAVTTLLGLDKATATRAEMLAAAAERGLLDGVTVVDGEQVPAVPPPGTSTPAHQGTAHPTPAAPAAPSARQTPYGAAPGRDTTVLPRPSARIPRPARARFTAITGQLSLDQALTEHRHLRLIPTTTTVLGAAA